MSNRKALLVFGALLAVLLLAAFFGRRSQILSPVSSSYSASPRGLKALYLYLKESGINVARFQESFESLPKGMNQMMVVSEPSHTPVTQRDAGSLLNWVKRGNFVIMGSRCGEGIVRPSWDSELLEAFGIACSGEERGPQELLARRITVFPTFSLSLNRGVRSVSAGKASAPNLELSEGIALLQHEKVPVAALIQLGKGAVLFLSMSSVLENSEIGRQDNLQLVWNFLLFAGIHTVYFDEYHHGHRQAFSDLSLRRLRILSWTALQLLALLLIFLVAGSGRLGPERQRLLRKGRSATETIDSLALLFLDGRKYRYLCSTLQQNLLADLSKKYHLAKNLSNWNEFVQMNEARIIEPEKLREMLKWEFPSQVQSSFLEQYAAGVDVWRKRMKL